MAEPGTTPSATEPQKKEGSTEGKKLIAGKFSSMEEAVEQGYVGLEKKVTEVNEKLSAVTKLLEDALTAPDPNKSGTVAVGQAGSDNDSDPYGRYEEFKIDPAQFLANPGKVIKQVEDRAYGRAMRASADLIANAMVVQEFKSQNRDLIPHEPLVASFMGKTDPKKLLGERLEDAGTKTRAYLGKLKAEWTGDSRTPSSSEYVEGPGGERTPAPKGDEGEPDETLASYVKNRHVEKSRHFGLVAEKK